MPEYLLSVHNTVGAEPPAPEFMERMYAQVSALNDEMHHAGVWVFAGGLQPADTAQVVRRRDDGLVVTDGPYLEGKEVIGGFWIILVPDADQAAAWARRAAQACEGDVEVRAFQPVPRD